MIMGDKYPNSDPSVLNAIILEHMDITFLLVNKTLVPVASLSPSELSRAKASEIAATVFLSLLLTVSLAANLCVVGTVSLSSRLRESAVYNLLAHLSGTCLLDTVVNMSISIVYIQLVHWTLPPALCSLNSFLMLFVSAVMFNAVVCLNVERYFFIRNPVKHVDHMKPVILWSRVGCIICWFILAALYAPVAVDNIVQAVAFPHRYSCGPNGNYARFYMIALMISSHILSMTIILLCLFLTARNYYSKRRMEQRLRKVGAQRDSPAMRAAALINEESRNIKLVLALTAAYVLLVLPQILTVHEFQVTHSPVPTNTTPYQDFLSSLMANGLSAEEIKAVQRNQIQLKKVYEAARRDVADLVPLVKEVDESDVQTGLVWCRYLYSAVVPILILCLQDDIKLKTGAFLRHALNRMRTMCERSHFKRETNNELKPIAYNSSTSPFSFSDSVRHQTPVLFITDYGLYLRKLDLEATMKSRKPVFQYVYSDIVKLRESDSDEMKPIEDEKFENIEERKEEEEFIPLTESIKLEREETMYEVTKQPNSNKKVVRFSPVVQEIPAPTLPYLSNTFLIDQLRGYLASQGIVLLSEPTQKPTPSICSVVEILKQTAPRSTTQVFLRERVQRSRKKMSQHRRNAWKAPLRISETVNKIKQPWKI